MGPWPGSHDWGQDVASHLQSREDSQTLFFVLRNFHTRYKRWPNNATEVKLFASNKAFLQPDMPSRCNESWFDDAIFSTISDGGLRIDFRNGSMSIGPM